ncbi:Oxysterol-binding protein-like protein [Lachnellula hyalina]|uniref:Oxysterol-binding protein-like protein n=1 Tax=Lachnellula hyalina TaxID=1316788 RepID=A0A8H8RA34_9HELO|nr:Oxysterol-binding protein-like protein [Lachnellula hyalina]TVY30457.1 Oxysterol-binding protein-like protein [Lachnellula hyalina]
MVSLVHSHRRASAASASNRSSIDDSRSDGPEDDTTVVEPEQGNVLSHIISQLRPGADLSRVVLPTFILEPRSMLERITNFMAHPEMLLPIPELDDPVQRFVSVVKFYLSGWHIKPPGVKKPLNPILGETFTGYWDFPDGTRGYYISEQTSHHPPKSSYFYMAPEHHIRIDGTLKPRSKFLGNSAASMMEGIAFLSFLNRGKGPKGERYIISQPNMYARGILFGKMKYELGDHSFVRCPELGLSADVEFKTKGYFGGTYNAIGGAIKNEKTGEVLYELSGMWTNEMWIKDVKTGKKELLFDATRAKHTPPTSRPIEEQDDRESQKLWLNTAQAVKERNHVVATDEKTKIEDMQRDEAAKRAEEGVEWVPRLFRPVQGGPGGIDEGEEDLDWILNANIDGATPEKQVEQILAVTPILRGQKSNEKNPIPKRNPSIISTNTPAKAAPAPAPAPAAPAPAPTGASDLINFGQNETSVIPADLKAAQTENGGQQQKELESTLSNTSTVHADGKGKGPLLDLQDLTAALPAKQTLLREDTDTHSVDEFHDAKA